MFIWRSVRFLRFRYSIPGHRHSYYPDMEASFVKNLRDTTQAVRQTDIEAIGVGLPVWALVDELYDIFNYHDHVDYILKPSILTPPMYHMNAPTSVRLGTFGVEVAVATVHTYSELRHQGYDTGALDAFHRCFYAAVKDEVNRESFARMMNGLIYSKESGITRNL